MELKLCIDCFCSNTSYGINRTHFGIETFAKSSKENKIHLELIVPILELKQHPLTPFRWRLMLINRTHFGIETQASNGLFLINVDN